MAPKTAILASSLPEAWRSTAPLPYTSDPWHLFVSDLLLFISNGACLPFIVWPMTPCNSGPLDELYPSAANIFTIIVHMILCFAQIAFLLSLPLCLVFFVPFGLVVAYAAGFVIANYLLCKLLLNGRKPVLESKADLSRFPDKHEDEKWIFINGVAVGSHWLQSNIDRLSLTFGRKITGVHNPTSGVMFDVLECVLQRDFTYVTDDIRNGYAALKDALQNPRYEKVVFILHSQGGIEGGLILDWLFAEMPGELIAKLEVYTFGNAANHFNDPLRTLGQKHTVNGTSRGASSETSSQKLITHIEHYANHFDYVSRCGVLEFASDRSIKGRTNRFAGRCFEQHGRGHQFNQHYLGTMFAFDQERGYGIAEHNPFIDADVEIVGTAADGEDWLSTDAASSTDSEPARSQVLVRNLTSMVRESGSASLLSSVTRRSKRKVRDYSRLWQYRNGQSPKD